MSQNLPDLDDVRAAYMRIQAHTHRTPVLTSRALNRRLGRELFFKCENLQRAGAFKFRGATNAVLSLTEEEARRGVATHSSGNHGAALALAASLRGIPAFIVMPRNSSAVKLAAVKEYGGNITLCDPTLAARESTLDEVVARTGATFVHPYNHPRVIAGQGTAALELLEQVPDLDLILAPVGGGGLLSGTAIVAAAAGITVAAGEPAGADDAYQSLQRGELVPSVEPRTVADGLLTSLGSRTFEIIRRHVSAIYPVSEAGIVAAMRLVWERMKIIIEPSSAVPLAALAEHEIVGARVGIILSGGNVDLEHLPW